WVLVMSCARITCHYVSAVARWTSARAGTPPHAVSVVWRQHGSDISATHMTIPIIERAGPLLERYRILLCDVWGVVHDGITAYPGANDALPRFRRAGGVVILVSNAPRPGPSVAQILDEKGVTRDAWDAIVSSGDIALDHIAEAGYQRLYRIGPNRRDSAFFDGLPGPHTTIAESGAVVRPG